MGYSVRVDVYRYTAWVAFNQTLALPNFTNVVVMELYVHPEAPLLVDRVVEHTNVAADTVMKGVAGQLHRAILQCGQRPDKCPPEALDGLV